MKQIKNNYYVYIYLDPRKPFYHKDLNFNCEPFYVGKGRGKRFIKSLYDPFNNKIKKSKIDEIKNCGFEPITIIISENLSEKESYFLEKDTINKIGINNLTNKSKGSSSKTFLKIFQNKKDCHLVIIVNNDSKFYELDNGQIIDKKTFNEEFKVL